MRARGTHYLVGESPTQGEAKPLFEPYQRRDGWLEEAVIQMYKSGMGTRDVARFIESMFGSHYSPTTISNITATVLEDIQNWQARRYVNGEVIYFAMGIDEEGHRQVLGFYIGGQESANGWRDVLKDLYSRGVEEFSLACLTGLQGSPLRLKKPIRRRMYSTVSSTKCVPRFLKSGYSTKPKSLRISRAPQRNEVLGRAATDAANVLQVSSHDKRSHLHAQSH